MTDGAAFHGGVIRKRKGSGMTKVDLIERMAEKQGVTQEIARIGMKALTDAMVEALVSGDRVVLAPIGVLKVVEVGPKVGRNPKTQEEIAIPARRVVRFRMSAELRERMVSS